MMKKLAIFCFVLTIFALVLGISKSDNSDSCNYKGIHFKKGETVPGPLGQCIQLTCNDPAYNGFGAVTCPSFQLGPDCKIEGENLTKLYPDCCPKPVC